MRKIFEKIPIWLIYTVTFGFIILFSFGALRLMGQTTIWNMDGITQHYPILEEFYRILRGTGHQSLFSWSWNLGLGADQMTTFSYYVVGDPFSYLIALFPADKIQLGYQALTILRVYAVGLAFLTFAKQMKLKRTGSLISTLIYTFCSFSFYVAYHHPFFLLPMIFFPLLCTAIDKIYHGQSFLWLVAITAIVLISNVYFAYLLAIGSLVFALVRYLDLKRKDELVRTLPKSFGYFVLTVVMALLISGMILLPNIMSMLNSSRSGSSIFANGLKLYPAIYYMKLPNVILDSSGSKMYWVVMGTSGLTLIAIMWSLRHFKKYLMLNLTLILIAVGLLLPQFAAVMNVMSTPSNRWVLLAQLPFALVAGLFIDHLHELVPTDFKWFMWGTLLLLALVWVGNGFIFKMRAHNAVMYGIYFVTLLVLAYGFIGGLKSQRLKLSLFVLVVVNAASMGLGFYSSKYSDTTSSQLSRGVAPHWISTYYDYANRYLAKHDKSFYRTGETSDYYALKTAGNNIPMLLNMHSISSYFSVQNGDVDAVNKELLNSENTMNNPTRNVDNRTTFSSLLNVKYLFVREDEVGKSKVPYGFEPIKDKDGQLMIFQNQAVYTLDNHTGTAIYRNKYALPLAYTQSQQLDKQSYQKLSASDKEQAMLDGALTDHKVSGVKTVKAATTAKTVPYTVKMNYLPITTEDQAIAYQVKHDTGHSVLSQIKSKELTPKQIEAYDQIAKTKKPTKAITNMMKQNQVIVKKDSQTNQNGLKTMTSDVLGQNADYQITLKNPSAYKNSELYIEFDGIKTKFPSISDRLDYTARRSIMGDVPFSQGAKLNYWRDFMNNQYFNSYNLQVTTQNKGANILQLGINNLSDYEKRDKVLINLGYAKQARKTINVSFTKANQMSFKHVRVIAVPFGQSYRQKTTQIQKQGLKQLKVTNNHVSGTTDRTQASVLTTSIPYTKGWHLTVDGRSTPTQQVNTGFVGAKIPAGKHQIRLTYQTPGLSAGRLLSALGLVLFGLGAIWNIWRWLLRRRTDRQKQQA